MVAAGRSRREQLLKSARSYWPVLLLLLMWAGVVVFREPIRVKWWEMRLRSAVTDSQQLYYFRLLSSVGPSALASARSLTQDEDPALRSFGVGILHHIEGRQARELLVAALDDEDSGVKEMGLMGLAMRKDLTVLPRLQTMAEGGDAPQALAAVVAFGEYDCTAVSKFLCRIARQHSVPLVRAQAIEQIGYLGCRDAVPTLIKALDDNVAHQGTTVLEQLDEHALHELSTQRGGAGELPYSVNRFRTVSDHAAMSLRMITGQSFGFDSTETTERQQAAQTAWRQWWVKQLAG